MATAEEVFNSTKLEVIVPEEPLQIPAETKADDWLLSLANVRQRDRAFFDERLLLFLTVKIPHPGNDPADLSRPPPLEIAQFLSRLQITLDAKYIAAQQPQPNHHRGTTPGAGRGISLAPPPRSHSHRNNSRLSQGETLSIFPPHTPNPTPQTDEADRKYANSSARTDGIVLESSVWGETQREDPGERSFALLWSSRENVWIAVYRLNIGVSFLRTPVSEPLLSLTVSTTLREKPLKITLERKAIADLLDAAGGGTSIGEVAPVAMNGVDDSVDSEDELHGLEEVNLLDGLSQGTTFGGPGSVALSLPSVRLGESLRKSAYSLPPIHPISPKVSTPSTHAPIHKSRGSNPVLRKSFLKTLQTVSGFQIRMKSVFVPYVVMPGSTDDKEERHEAGSEERTVVLSVELGNGSVARGPGAAGFSVEGVEVSVGGEGATANLIGWGETGFERCDTVFPLLMGPAEQFNLLYAITFMRQSEEDDVADTMRGEPASGKDSTSVKTDMQRHVSIVVCGRPYDWRESLSTTTDDAVGLSYPTRTFRSRWNCVLDLSTASQNDYFSQNPDIGSEPLSARDALPAPASPFPAVSPKTARQPVDRIPGTPPPNSTPAVAGSKRHTIGGLTERGHRVTTASNARYRASTSMINSQTAPGPIAMPSSAGGRFAHMSPSVIINNLPSPGPGPRTPGVQIPPTPAYPAYPAEFVPQTPAAQSPISSLHVGAGAGSSVEPRRERMTMQGGTPQTPGPRMTGAYFADRTPFEDAEDDGDPVVVSVGLVSPGESVPSILDMIYVLDTFGIEIFVFNRSDRTRRFEASYPERKRRRQQLVSSESSASGETQVPGILPLENRIRIGPLRPHTCQSVRMQFLALQPGLHSIYSLILTDVETGYSKNLKSVMDVVVHEAEET